ncbi:MAG: 5-methylcytosine restriction system specificity protein McrC [Actinomycetota bacterium]
MHRLFEQFVAELLKANLSAQSAYRISAQKKFLIQSRDDLHFRIDIVIRDAAGRPIMVLDTQCKVGSPSAVDIAQAVAYAEGRGLSAGASHLNANSRRAQLDGSHCHAVASVRSVSSVRGLRLMSTGRLGTRIHRSLVGQSMHGDPS